jgi:hypothetical protein
MPTVDLFQSSLGPATMNPRKVIEINRLHQVFARNSGWAWYVTEGCSENDDFIFFGFVVGGKWSRGNSLSELNELPVRSTIVQRDLTSSPRAWAGAQKRPSISFLSKCLSPISISFLSSDLNLIHHFGPHIDRGSHEKRACDRRSLIGGLLDSC